MARTSWRKHFARFASAAAIAALVCAAIVWPSGDDAEACAGWSPSISDMTTFDPGVLGDDAWGGLAYDPFEAGFGGACDRCAKAAARADWQGFLKDAVTEDDWEQVLFKAQLKDIFAIEQRLSGKTTKAPEGYEDSSLWSNPRAASQLYRAVEFVELLKRMEPQVTFEIWTDKPRPAPGTTLAKELAAAQRGLKAAKEPFLQQRYAFAVVRALFYRQDWPATIAFFDNNAALLSAPSEDLTWRARFYVAGALRKSGQAGRANLELARIHAGYTPLAGAAVFDFKPAEEVDWQESLRLSKNPKEKAALWSMIGIKHDPVVGAQEILKLDPTSKLIPLLLVRELSRVESMVDRQFMSPPDKQQVAAQKKAYAKLEQLARKLLATPGAAKPYVYELMLGHIASKRGDLAATRAHAQQAVAMAPRDRRVASQAKASVAIVLARNWKITPQNEDELATLMREIDPRFGRMSSVSDEVRTKLAFAYVTANRMIDAEFLAHGVRDASDDGNFKLTSKIKTDWQFAPFLKEMIARTDQRTTEFDRFVLSSSHVKEDLQHELAVRYVLDGDFPGAKLMFKTTKAPSDLLRTDPFVIHVIDCHDCDHEKFGEQAKWTHENLVDRMLELDAIAKGGGEKGAQAALQLGNALYNITHNGNARSFTDNTHQDTSDARLAERYYKKVYDTTGNRELKAQAAWLAAKAELGTLIYKEQNARPNDFVGAGRDAGMMIPKTWFPIFKKFSDTRYYKEVLAECGRFRNWVGGN
jgi:outer membrane protein W